MRLKYGLGQPQLVRAADILKSPVEDEGRDAGIGVRLRCRSTLLWAGTRLAAAAAAANFL
jgi:hypothetical protein